MRRFVTLLLVWNLAACAKKESPSSAGSGSSSSSAVVQPTTTGSATPTATATGSAAATDSATPATGPGSAATTPSTSADTDAVAKLVVADVGSKALGSQKIEASCVSVSVLPSGDWLVAAARLKDCGDKTARTILWVFKGTKDGRWSEDYVGQPPRCWKGVPADIAVAVSKLTKIPSC